jgi:S1-C subfamily serine protease
MSEEMTATPVNTVHMEASMDILRSKILHTLSIFPYLSQSMIQVGIGTAISPNMWKPLFQELIAEGKIVKTDVSATSPLERAQTYQVYHLPQNPYNFKLDNNSN